jgi:hypothetical protein
MRQADPPVLYLVGTPKGRLSKLQEALLGWPWRTVRQGEVRRHPDARRPLSDHRWPECRTEAAVKRLKLDLPSQPPPRITASAGEPACAVTQQA